MDPTRFDRLSKVFATRRTRRQAFAVGGAGLVAGVAALQHGTAQDATPLPVPAGTPTDPHPSADGAGTDPEYLFVQPFDAGTWAPKAGVDGVYTLTLTGAAAQTTYFSDRPERIVGLSPTQTFLDGLGFTPETPPNAALVAQTDAGQDILVIELLDPVYDAGAGTLSYDATVLADYGGRGLASLAQQQTDYELPEAFGEGSLFIDDCPDSPDDNCWVNAEHPYTPGKVTSGNCWNSSYTGDAGCSPCNSWSYYCNLYYPDDCKGNCVDDIYRCGWAGCTGL
jgi:hypothetical protein